MSHVQIQDIAGLAASSQPALEKPFALRMKAGLEDALSGHPVNTIPAFSRIAALHGVDVALVLERRSRGELRALGVAFHVIVEDQPQSRESDRLFNIAMRAFGVSRNDILSARRTRRIVMARHFIIHWLFRRTSMSSPMIGLRMKKDHSTTLYARDTWPEKRAEARQIRRSIRAGLPVNRLELAERNARLRGLIGYAGREVAA